MAKHVREQTVSRGGARPRTLGSALTDTLKALRQGQLSGARELRLGGLGLTEVPSEIFGLADTLEVLDLGGNALRRLPDDFARLARLKVLFASGNPIERLPPVLGDCPELGQVGFRVGCARYRPRRSQPGCAG